MADKPASPLKNLSPSEFSRVSQLLDESIGMPPQERDAWLGEIGSSDPAIAALLRQLFASQARLNAQGFLETQDLMPSQWASLQGDSGLIGKRFGPYRVVSLLGHGGMGSVWLAERVDGLFTRQVALKFVHPALIGRAVSERFTREREILASLSHPNIARLFDAGISEHDQPFLALEYIAGTPLTGYCDDRRLGVRQRLELFLQVLGAVQYAHAHLVIHRDLKPSNILVTKEGQAHLLDFGIAKLLREGEGRQTQLTQIAGRAALTPDYAAPEQITGAPITTATDIYSLGVTLYELLVGLRPYRLAHETRGELERAILQVEPVLPSRAALSEAAAARGTTPKKLSSELKGDIDTIVDKSLKKSPAERYATADAFAADIGRYLRGEAVLARRDSVAYRAAKFARRHRVGIAAIGILLATLAGGLAATSYEAKVASRQRDAALTAQRRLLTLTAAGRLKDNDIAGAMGIVLDILPHQGSDRRYEPAPLSVFQETRAADAQVMIITGHTDRVRCAAFSPDGSRLVSASYDKTARIWDVATGLQLTQFSGHVDRLRCAAFSPDGRRVVSASLDKTARIWDAATGREEAILSGHSDRVLFAEFSPDGRRVITASADKTARIWDAATGKEILALRGHTGVVATAVFSPDGRRVLTASRDNSAVAWDALSGRKLIVFSGHSAALESAAFSPDGKRIVTSSLDKTARIWDAGTAQELTLLNGHTQLVESAVFSPDGRRVVTASDDKTARIWDADTGRQIGLLSGHKDQVIDAVFSPDGRRVATASEDGSVRIWDAADNRELLVLRGHTAVVAGADYSPDGGRIATASADNTARIWEAASGRELMQLSGHTALVLSAEFSPDGRRVVTASDDGTARIWEVATGRELMRLIGHTQQVEGAAFSPDGRRIVTASYDRTARIWDAETARQLTQLSGHTAQVNWAGFSPDGRRIVTSSFDKTARVWDVATGRQLLVLRGHTGSVATAAFSPDGGRLVTASDDKTARVWDAASGREILTLIGHSRVLTSAAFSPDGRHIVTSSNDQTARIWDASTGEQLLVVAHPEQVETAAFSPDGLHIVTASDDKNAHVWDVRALPIGTQIRWARAALFDDLSGSDRSQLGLPPALDVRHWPSTRTRCDESAAAPYDPDRRAQGAMADEIVADVASAACAAGGGVGSDPRSVYQRGRADRASGKSEDAKREIEQALAGGYRAAGIDLASLLTTPSRGAADLPRAIALYERAWQEGVAIAAFELGKLYELGAGRGGPGGRDLLVPDESRAWFWYQKAVDAGEPNALARFAERDDAAALTEPSTDKKRSLWLASFKYYAAAAERARIEDWPDHAWRNWRYRRASLARLLAREGMMGEVAEAFDGVRIQNTASATIWERLTALVQSVRVADQRSMTEAR